MIFRCPTCGRRFQPEQLPGQEVFSCSRCGQRCQIEWLPNPHPLRPEAPTRRVAEHYWMVDEQAFRDCLDFGAPPGEAAPEPPKAESRTQSAGSPPSPLELPSFRAAELPSPPEKEPMIDFKKKRFLVIIDRDREGYVRQVFNGYDWARVVDLGSEGFPLPPGQRLVSDAAWQVLRAGAKIPLQQLTDSMEVLGTKHVAQSHRTDGESWTVAELHRRALGETEDFEP